MPIDFSNLPDKPKQQAGDIDFSGLPDQPQAPQAAPQAPAAPQGLWERMGGWRGLAGTGVRGLSGLLSGIVAAEPGPGTALGAGIAGGGESLAEAIEQTPQSPARIATEAALGAVPFGEIVKGGRLAASALRSGLLGATGAGMREYAAGQPLDPTSIALSGGLSALLGAGGAKLAGRVGAPAPEVPPTYEIEPTAVPGGRVLTGQKKAPLTTVQPIPPIVGTKTASELSAEQAAGRQVSQPLGEVPPPPTPRAAGVPYGGAAPPPYRASARAAIAAEAKAAKEAAAQRAAVAQAQEVQDRMAGFEEVPASMNAAAEQARRFSLAKTGAKIDEMNARAAMGEDIPESRIDEAVRSGTLAPEPETPTLSKAVSPSTVEPARTEPGGIEGVTPESVKAAQEARAAELAQAQQDLVGGATPKDVTPSPTSSLLKFFRTPGGAAGYNYRLAKQAEAAGEIPTAEYARAARLRTIPEAPSTPSAPAIEPSPESPDWIKEQTGVAEAAAQMDPTTRASFLDRLKRLASEGGGPGGGEAGGITAGLVTKMGAPLLGAAIGAPAYSAYDPEDPDAALKGALAGGLLGYAATGGGQELINWRNAGLLAGPAQLKKPLSDVGAYLGTMGEKTFSADPAARAQALPLAREALRVPTNVANYVRGLLNPELARDVVGDVPLKYTVAPSGPLGLIARPFSAAQYATQEAMRRAGVGLPEAREALMLGDPKTALGRWWMQAQTLPGASGQIVRALRPFQRIATNIAERGVERLPGPSLFMGDPSTRVARTIMGAGALGAGALTGMGDVSEQAQTGEPVSPVVKGLRRAFMASYGLPFTVGESIAGETPREIYNLLPGLSQTLPPPAPSDTTSDYLKKRMAAWLEQMLPDYLSPGSGTAR